MPNPATPQDVANRWRPLTETQTTNAATFLADAWRELRRRVPDVETRLDAATDDDLRDEVVKVLANAVLRVLKNPDGSLRESVDDAVWQPNQAAASGLLYLDDVDLLPITQPVAPGTLSGAYVISLGG